MRKKPAVIPGGAKWCHRCKRVKPVGEFYPARSRPGGLSAYCRQCSRIDSTVYAHSPGGSVTRAAYKRCPAVKARAAAKARIRRLDPDVRRREQARNKTPIGKLVRARQRAAREAARATTDRTRRDRERRLAEVETELRRVGWTSRKGDPGLINRSRENTDFNIVIDSGI